MDKQMLMQMAMGMLTEDGLRNVADSVIDNLKNEIKNDGVEDYKDKVVLPLLEKIERAFGLDPD